MMKIKIIFLSIVFKLFKCMVVFYILLALFLVFLPGIMSAYSPDVPPVYIDMVYNATIVEPIKRHYWSTILLLPWTRGIILAIPLFVCIVVLWLTMGGGVK